MARYGHSRGTLLSTARRKLFFLLGQAEVDKVLDMLMGKDVAAENEIEEAKTSTRQMVDPVCEYCLGIATVPFAQCWYCGIKPSYHHGRCCPMKPRQPGAMDNLSAPVAEALFENRARSRSPRGVQILTFHFTITVYVRRYMRLPEAMREAISSMVVRFWHVIPRLTRQRRELEHESAEVGPDGDLERHIHVDFNV